MAETLGDDPGMDAGAEHQRRVGVSQVVDAQTRQASAPASRTRFDDALIARNMLDDVPKTADLLEAWRDATRAADLARRLAEVAAAASAAAERDAAEAEEVAALAEATAQAAEGAAQKARATATRMHDAAEGARGEGGRGAAVAAEADQAESSARDRYHEAESETRARRDSDRP
jgi:hypothetical protein